MKLSVSPYPSKTYPWFIMKGTFGEEERLQKAFTPLNSNTRNLNNGDHTVGRIILTSPDGTSSIAVEAFRLLNLGVFFDCPYVVHPLSDRPNLYGGVSPHLKHKVTDKEQLGLCGRVVGDMLVKDGFITAQQSYEFFGSDVLAQQQNTTPKFKIVDQPPGDGYGANPWFGLYGSRDDQDRLEAVFKINQVAITGGSGNKYSPTLRVIQIPNSSIFIAIGAAHHRRGDGVWFQRPFYVQPIDGKPGHYEGRSENLVKGAPNLAICKHLVAQILLTDGFINQPQCKELGGEFEFRKPQAAIVAANPTPAPSAPLGKPVQR